MKKQMGITVPDLLGVMFIGLKLAGVIAWSWILVTCPLWIELVGILVVTAIEEKKKMRRK